MMHELTSLTFKDHSYLTALFLTQMILSVGGSRTNEHKILQGSHITGYRTFHSDILSRKYPRPGIWTRISA